tara:strand:+ start:2655 stop:3047 length:393 start_codon:yes stop_codon:yes gene_type:complete
MEIIATNKLELIPLVLPFAYSFSYKKRGDDEAWFTPSGKAKIWFGGLQTQEIGNITKEEEKALHKEMKKAKADILWGGKYKGKLYTTCGNITLLPNVQDVLAKLVNEWCARYKTEDWTNACGNKYSEYIE